MAGYSDTPLLKKLGIKPGDHILVVNEPPAYWDWIHPLPEGIVAKKKTSKSLNFAHLFLKERRIYEREVLKIRKSLHPDGMIWISWPKKSSKVVTDLDENVIRGFALKNGLVDIKVCAIDEIWSGLKLVIPVKERMRLKKVIAAVS